MQIEKTSFSINFRLTCGSVGTGSDQNLKGKSPKSNFQSQLPGHFQGCLFPGQFLSPRERGIPGKRFYYIEIRKMTEIFSKWFNFHQKAFTFSYCKIPVEKFAEKIPKREATLVNLYLNNIFEILEYLIFNGIL